MATFKALQIRALEKEQETEYQSHVVERTLSELPAGDVLIKVLYSSLNYKDALSASGNKGVTRHYPHTPGIDAAGIVMESTSNVIQEGDEVIVTGYDLGMNTAGGLSEYIRVPATWVVPRPAHLSLRQAMILGTAGFTAGLSVDTLLQVGINASQGPVLVTGATGGVGSIAVWLLAKLGFTVIASTGKANEHGWLQALGASEILSREALLDNANRPMLKPRWMGVVDTLGGQSLAQAIKATHYAGTVTCCGLAESPTLTTSLFPFILRGINLMGIDSVELPLPVKIDIWNSWADDWKFDDLVSLEQAIVREIRLADVPDALQALLASQHRGRYLVNVRS